MVFEVAVLHRHWVWANRFRTRFDAHLGSSGVPSEFTAIEDWFIDLVSWYGHLYVTIEGWRELGLHDPDLDRLLSSSNVKSLKRLRNCVWHFQPHWVAPKILAFMVEPNVVGWVREVNSQFGRFFLEWHEVRERTGSQ